MEEMKYDWNNRSKWTRKLAKVKRRNDGCYDHNGGRNGFYEGKLSGRDAVVVRSGIGKGECGDVRPDPGRPFRRQCDY